MWFGARVGRGRARNKVRQQVAAKHERCHVWSRLPPDEGCHQPQNHRPRKFQVRSRQQLYLMQLQGPDRCPLPTWARLHVPTQGNFHLIAPIWFLTSASNLHSFRRNRQCQFCPRVDQEPLLWVPRRGKDWQQVRLWYNWPFRVHQPLRLFKISRPHN